MSRDGLGVPQGRILSHAASSDVPLRPRPRRASLIGIVFWAAAGLGCTPGPGGGQSSAPSAPLSAADGAGKPVLRTTPSPGVIEVSPSSAPRSAGLQMLVDAALADAAQRTGIAAAMLKVASAEAVTWSDGSLGCPQPGLLYTQALVPGYRIRIDAGGQILDYHAGARGGAPRLCPPGRAIAPVGADPRV